VTMVTDEDLDALLELSDVDANRARVAATLADLPAQQEVDAAVARRKTEVEAGDAIRVEVTTVEADQRRFERELQQYRDRLSYERDRLYGGGVTNAKESKAVEVEISTTVAKIAEHENGLLEAMEAAEELSERIEAAAGTVEQTSATIVELEAARDAAAQQLMAQMAELDVTRDALRETMAPHSTIAYDKVRARIKLGAAVGELRGSSCSACRIGLPHAEVNELRDGPNLNSCPNCSRLLIVRR
jgi:predicted  nucleic acid-binding Zn-ribbon protein